MWVNLYVDFLEYSSINIFCFRYDFLNSFSSSLLYYRTTLCNTHDIQNILINCLRYLLQRACHAPRLDWSPHNHSLACLSQRPPPQVGTPCYVSITQHIPNHNFPVPLAAGSKPLSTSPGPKSLGHMSSMTPTFLTSLA